MRETAAMMLTEFLLARIAEDEAAANGVNRGLFNSRVALLPPDLYGLVIRQHPARVLAECEAKRRIVERAAEEPADLADQRDIGLWEGYVAAAEELATIYADHADYREEWRP